MIESLIVTLLPVLFLAVLFGGGRRFRLRNIDMDGAPPIDGRLFYASKYSIILVWLAMVLQHWGIDLSVVRVPEMLGWLSFVLWIFGFALLFIGRFGLGESFRLGSPLESTRLKVKGLFGLSRNPMYLGVFATLAAAVLSTLNPIVLALGLFIGAVHHRIVLAEERYLRGVFGEEYGEYCRRVRRYI